MACTLGNKCAKNCCKRTILVQHIVEDVVAYFFETQCSCVSAEYFVECGWALIHNFSYLFVFTEIRD